MEWEAGSSVKGLGGVYRVYCTSASYYTRAHKHEMNVNTVLYTQSSPGDFNCCDNNFFSPHEQWPINLPGVSLAYLE